MVRHVTSSNLGTSHRLSKAALSVSVTSNGNGQIENIPMPEVSGTIDVVGHWCLR